MEPALGVIAYHMEEEAAGAKALSGWLCRLGERQHLADAVN